MSTVIQPVLDQRIKGRKGFGLIQLFEGHGKGKTTAALGEALRAVGAGKRVAIVFFDKGGDHYGERVAMSELMEGKIEFHGTGRDRIDPVTGRFDFEITDVDRSEGERGLRLVREIFARGEHELVIMDEINSSADLGIVSVESVLELVDSKPDHVELVMTGRNAPSEFKERAHLVTEMKLVKHYFYSGVPAREGLDY